MKSKIELKPNQTIVFIGDSITDADRMSAAYKPFGTGYVHFTANALLAKYPQLNLNIINSGVGGSTVLNMRDRWEKDCIGLKPDILSVMIGVNDLWRQYREPHRLPDAVFPDEYEVTYRQLLLEAKQKTHCKMILMEPFMFCGDANNAMLRNLQNYIRIVHKLAEEFDAVLVPVQKYVDKIIGKVESKRWSEDMVHPYMWAHCWISQGWLEATGL